MVEQLNLTDEERRLEIDVHPYAHSHPNRMRSPSVTAMLITWLALLFRMLCFLMRFTASFTRRSLAGDILAFMFRR